VTAKESRVREVLAWLAKRGSRRNREGMARYGIVAPKAFGVTMASLRTLAKKLGRDHDLARELWDTGWYEASQLCAFVDEPARVTAPQMDRWVRDFDNWAICDGICFHLFDRTPHAWKKIEQWGTRKEEFVRRASFALLASVALHDKEALDPPFARSLRWIERAASDERNFVKKGVSWALRSVGRRSLALNEASVDVARRLMEAEKPAARWVGRDAHKELTSAAVRKRLAAKSASPRKRTAKKAALRPSRRTS
jgi:3-methyladenine DNA glycosylase AlkD